MDLEGRIRSRIQTLLPTCDTNSTSERDIRETLEKEFGTSMEKFKPVIKEEVHRYLDLVAQQDTDIAQPAAPAPQPAAQSGAAEASAGKRKREAAGGAAEQPDSSSSAGGAVFELSELKRVDVRLFKGHVQVDIRDMYKDNKDGQLKPAPKGLALSPEQWALLAVAMPHIDAALADGNTSYALELSGNRRATVEKYKGQLRVDLRELYEKDGSMLPGKKGVTLPPPEWQHLRDSCVAVQAAVDALLPQSAAADAVPTASPAKQARTSAAPQNSPQQEEDFAVTLSSNRRASVRKYQGKVLVDLRETYEKDGKKLPGKKGIALLLEQFRVLKGAAAELTTALQASDTSYSHALGSMRKASIQVFKKVARVSVREFYTKRDSTEELPTKKGLEMPADEWSALCDNLGALEAEAERLIAA